MIHTLSGKGLVVYVGTVSKHNGKIGRPFFFARPRDSARAVCLWQGLRVVLKRSLPCFFLVDWAPVSLSVLNMSSHTKEFLHCY